MIWTKLKITLSKCSESVSCNNFVEDISNLLVIAGADTFTVEDFSDLEDTLSGGGIFYDYIDENLLNMKDFIPVIYAYFATDEEGEGIYNKVVSALECIKAKEGYQNLVWSRECVKDEDWENNWRQYFKPFAVGNKLAVKPTWEELPQDLSKNRYIIEIDPSSSFGTGSHATTRLCLEALEDIIQGGEKVLDMGCGSGILTIASKLLGADNCVAVDIDEVAARIAKENMEQNGLYDDVVKVYSGDVISDTELYKQTGDNYDVICANIVAAIIIQMSDMFYEKLKNNGILIASGIISERENEVKEALLRSGFNVEKTQVSEDWLVIVCKKTK